MSRPHAHSMASRDSEKVSVLPSMLQSVPAEIVSVLENEYGELEARFARRDWGPAELNGGRFAEAVLRYLEWKESGSFTALGKQLNRSNLVNRVRTGTHIPDGTRFHVTACAELLMDLRNKRDVAHLGGVVDVNEMDAHLVMRLSSWALAEIVREESGLTPRRVQELIDQLSARRVALVEEIAGQLVVVATELTAVERALVVLYHIFPGSMATTDIQRAIKYSNGSRLRSLLKRQESAGLVHRAGDSCYLTRKGAVWVEGYVDLRLDV